MLEKASIAIKEFNLILHNNIHCEENYFSSKLGWRIIQFWR